MTGDNRAPVTVIGLGMMGAALAGAFVKDGHPTTVWNRSAAKADALVAQGATLAPSLADAVAASDLVIVCLSTYETVLENLEPLTAALAGKVLVNVTSGTPEEARQHADWAAKNGISYLDGAILAIPPLIGQPEAFIFYAGTTQAFEAHQATLGKLGTAVNLGTNVGLASLYDTALLGIMWSTLAGFFHAVALVGSEGIKAQEFLPFASGWLGGVGSFLPDLARQVDEGDYATDISSLDVNKAAIDHLVHATEAQGVSTAVPAPIKELIDRRVAQGHGTHSLASLVELLKKPGA
ncbi:NAD(P)-binding domain-containing protein [Kitasatospora sp. SUK 42]|nr:NAD(P)-binding domain-containing protein [Kitasatospora sp. SUK 42]